MLLRLVECGFLALALVICASIALGAVGSGKVSFLVVLGLLLLLKDQSFIVLLLEDSLLLLVQVLPR